MAKAFFSRSAALGLAGTGGFLIAWEALSRSGLVSPVMLPAPSVVLRSGAALAETGELGAHLAASLWRAALGFAIGATLGVASGVAFARSDLLYGLFNPLVQVFRAIPSLAFVPLAIFWFGIGETSKIFLIAWGVFFPVWVNAFIGVRDVSQLFVRAGESLGASGWRMLIFVVLPAALPMILAGLRVSLSIAMVLLVAAELAGALHGVGYLIQVSQQVFRVDLMFVGLAALGLMGFAADLVFERAVRLLFPWYAARETGGRPARADDRRPMTSSLRGAPGA
ncbi:taurine ABC transporter permease [Methylopila jiangsuensis]|uniref:Taurine ABC transporter permease n=1 Tax=Methylopila jiangsuensis TaxID=586230 RepID=A0A9W6N4U8_9HYPH|nr:ABC transporter permease [Methylopila jiangsuensis]MDR6284899.1 NitT/TauT family transport system permease protein/sulfonate transport system permease protein [Methylopila jiangsuensis]GLK77713.1 taurine ABC transporter permease [Methylopila jiangsuensis]